MGIIKTGIQAGVAYAAVNKITKTMEATAQAKHGKQTPPHPPCNCPHCPYSEQSVYGTGAPAYGQQGQTLPPPPPQQQALAPPPTTAYGNAAPPPAPYGGRSASPPPPTAYGGGGGASPQTRALADPAPPYDPRADVQALFASAFEKRRR
ncbi:uncharacterized protein LOC62_05G007633 [Vanrija pseudolonga]|uniref:Uncharacterized protein n=1 Tax=Vanrija pseudolonga TaxID=143232 RepID=A0AAF0YFW4_9TREE|nr:hypothetical protein LOC62_05G007633 [Vanrija pseudolonga]